MPEGIPFVGNWPCNRGEFWQMLRRMAAAFASQALALPAVICCQR